MPAGRPPKYKKRFADDLTAHFKAAVPKVIKYTNEKTGKKESYTQMPSFPTLAGFCVSKDISRQTFFRWCNEKDEDGKLLHPELSYSYSKIRDAQRELLISGAMDGSYKENFSKFVAINNLGMKEKTEHTLTGPDGGPVKTIHTEMTAKEAADAYAEELKTGESTE